MITIKFYGLIGLDNTSHEVHKGKLKQIIDQIVVLNNIPKEKLMQSIIFVNKKQLTGLRILSTKINDGDEVVFLSPSSGG